MKDRMTHDWQAVVRAHLPPLDDPHEAEIVDELAQHLADLYADALADGASPEAAFATAMAVLTAERDRLALGVGANTAIVAAVDALLLRPLPYADADRLVVPVSVTAARDIDNASVSFADYTDWRREADIFDAVALWRPLTVDLIGAGDPERVKAVQVSAEFFQVITVTPLAGRTLTTADYAADAPRSAVIAHRLWRRTFGGADVVGRVVRVGGIPHEIVGVLPPRTVWPEEAALFVPMAAPTSTDVTTRRDNLVFQSVARLRDGVPIERGNAALAAIAQRLERDHPESRTGWTNRLTPMREFMVEGEVARAVWVLLAAVAAVLLIACANVAHLGLVRGLGRSREHGIRIALGASRWRLVRHVAVECVLLWVVGAAAAVAVAAWTIPALAAMAPPGTPFIEHLALDRRVLAAAMALSAVAVCVAGVVPAIVTARVQPGRVLHEASAAAGSSRRIRMLRQGLIVAEVAGAVVLLVGAALLVRSFWRLQQVDAGVDIDRVLSARLSLPRGPRYQTAAHASAFFQQLIERLQEMPGVEAAGATSFVPIGGGGFGLGRVFLPQGRPEPPAAPDVSAQWNVVTPDYFKTVGIPMLQGRSFGPDDRATSTPVVIVSRSFVDRMFGDEPAIGKRIRSWRDENLLREIVGVVADVRYTGLGERETLRQVYVPHTQNSWGLMNVVVQAAGTTPTALESSLRRAVAAADPELAVSNVATLRAVARDSVAGERYTALLLSVFAATALVLGALGIYGVVSHSLLMRRRELGLRAALGASARHLYAIVWTEGLRVTAIGLAVGVAGAIAASRGLEALLYETAPRDPAAYLVTIGTVLAVAGPACVGPARRAAHVDPLTELRQP